ncbi:MAG: hypothetical protein JRF72_15045 [Deltaproteobacteria bacterium]|jgi:uncharacterized lipoprotein YajG|nr:hypothetical protein [Deltaproteobacteria bacterium]
MQLLKRISKIVLLIILTGIWMTACTESQFLKVHYQFPPKPEALENITVKLSFTDMRRNKAILSQAARKSLSDFTGNFTLVVGPAEEDGRLLGVYNLESLFKETFRQRLQYAGVKVAEQGDSNAEIEIGLKEFRLDLKTRKWFFNMSYQLNLTQNGKLIASEIITGDAERLKTYGARDANKLISELVTDMINRLDVAAFFRSAGI